MILETGDFDSNLDLRQVTYMAIPAYVYLEDFDLDLKGTMPVHLQMVSSSAYLTAFKTVTEVRMLIHSIFFF